MNQWTIRQTTAKQLHRTALVLSTLMAGAAHAGVPFASGSQTLTTDILTLVTPIVGIAVIAVGVLCWFGRITWYWFVGLVVGIVLVFGNQQVVSWIRGLFGV
jgi:type IV secretion system protein VirB2